MPDINIPTFVVELVDAYPQVEGVGDNLTSVPTRGYGVTEQAYKSLNMPQLSDKEAATVLLLQKNKFLTDKMKGYKEAPIPVKKMLLDTAYNVGEYNIVKWPKLKNAVKNKNWLGATLNILDTANTKNRKRVKGLGNRRAWAANFVLNEIPRKILGKQIDAAMSNRMLSMFGKGFNKQINNLLGKGTFEAMPIRLVRLEGRKLKYYGIDGTVIYEY
jgi:GH24 family phage-related lysozyme (muramidase)